MIHSDHWHNRVEKFRIENKSIKKQGWFFLGDSITEEFQIGSYFSQPNIYNRGINGDTIDGLIERFSVSLPDTNPQKVFLMIGINDIGAGIKKEMIKENYEKLSSLLKPLQKNTQIYWLSLLPSRNEWPSYKPDMIKSLNQFIENICDEKKYTFINLYPICIDKTDQLKIELTNDGLHLNKNGYNLLAGEIRKNMKHEK